MIFKKLVKSMTIPFCYLPKTLKSQKVMYIKRALDKYNIIPQLFPKKVWDFYTIRSVGMGNDNMLSFTFQIDLLLKKYEYF